MIYTSLFVTADKTYKLQVTPFTCSRFGLAEFFAAHLHHLGHWEGKRVLDVGCGVGPLSILLADQMGCKVLGIDINPQAIDCFKANIRNYNLGNQIQVKLSNFYTSTKSDIKDEKWDMIVSNPPISDEVGVDVIEKYRFNDFSNLSREAFTYLTNAWRNEEGKDLLDEIFTYSNTALTPHGMLCVVFCSMSNVLPSTVVERAGLSGMHLCQIIEGKIPTESLGVRSIGIDNVTAYILMFNNTN